MTADRSSALGALKQMHEHAPTWANMVEAYIDQLEKLLNEAQADALQLGADLAKANEEVKIWVENAHKFDKARVTAENRLREFKTLIEQQERENHRRTEQCQNKDR